ncbi:MAG: type II secretion system protein [Gammaproteobacteria bacterium]
MGYDRGFTLIELTILLVVLGILVAVAIPKYESLATTGDNTMKVRTAAAVRDAYMGYLAAHSGTAPTVAQLGAELTGNACTVLATGISCTLKDGTVYVALTYTDNACTVATTLTTSIVGCIAG